jgi:hypothetical protein
VEDRGGHFGGGNAENPAPAFHRAAADDEPNPA